MGNSQHLSEFKSVLQENILQYWLKLRDPEGGFYGEVSANGDVIKDAPRGVILNARIIWAFAAAYRALGRKEYLDAAVWAKEWFLKHFCDHKYGGVYWSVSATGEPLEDKKQLYSQGFAIYGLSELARANGDKEALNEAVNLFKVVEAKFSDTLYGGYTEALARDFSPLEDMSLSAHDINADKTMNSHLHILEAFANLYRVWPDPSLKDAVERLLDITCKKVMGEDGHLKLYFKNDWTVLPGAVSYGHDIETSWLMLECAEALNDESVVSRVKPYALSLGIAGNKGLLPDGSMRYERLTDGTFDATAPLTTPASGGFRPRQWWVTSGCGSTTEWPPATMWPLRPGTTSLRILWTVKAENGGGPSSRMAPLTKPTPRPASGSAPITIPVCAWRPSEYWGSFRPVPFGPVRTFGPIPPMRPCWGTASGPLPFTKPRAATPSEGHRPRSPLAVLTLRLLLWPISMPTWQRNRPFP